MNNPYYTDEPTAISFSGGRTSAYMLYKVIEAHGGTLPDYVKVLFANTGKEMPETLDFVRDCGEQWGVDIVWVELDEITTVNDGNDGKRRKFLTTTKVVNHETASRNGEPFAKLISARRMTPNVMARFCTADLKTRRIQQHLMSIGFDPDHVQFVGLRADEPSRAIRTHNTKSEGHECFCPLYVDGVTKEQVGTFWEKQSFDLNLHNRNGVTDWGNCDLCYLKGGRKKLSLTRERPDLADWWIEQEAEHGVFRNDQPNYYQMKMIATDQGSLFEFEDDDTVPCFCTD